MILAAALSLLAAQPVTFDELLARLSRTASVPAQPTTASKPVVRLESTAQSSRSQELFVQTPFDLRAATMTLAVDYPLRDGGYRAAADAIAQADAADVRAAQTTVSDADFNALLDAFGDLYVARAALQRSTAVDDRTPALLAAGQISNTTAAAWQERALALRARQLDAELRKVDAEARLRELVGDVGDIEPVLEGPSPRDAGRGWREAPGEGRELGSTHPSSAADAAPSPRTRGEGPSALQAAERRVARARLFVREMEARRRTNVTLSGYVGAGAANSTFAGTTSSGAFGIYGLRVQLSLPLFDHTGEADVARAELELARAVTDRDAALREAKRAAAQESRRIEAQKKRIAILTESYDIARRRQESMARLVSAGLRSETDALAAAGEVAERAQRLDEARVEEWKSVQRLRRLGS